MTRNKQFELEGTPSIEGNVLRVEGFMDRTSMNLGVLNRTTTSAHVINPANGNHVYFTRLNYPVDGLGLEYVLSALAPSDRKRIDRGGTVDDWEEPDVVEELIARGEVKGEKVIRFGNHQLIPGFNEFNGQHRRPWIEVINRENFDNVFKFLGRVDFIEPEALTDFIRNFLGEYFARRAGSDRSIIADLLPQHRIGEQIIEMLAEGLEHRDVNASRRQKLDTDKLGQFFRILRLQTTIDKTTGQEVAQRKDMKQLTIYLPDDIKVQIHDMFWQILSVVPKDVEQNVLIALYNMYFQGATHVFMDPKSKRIWTHDAMLKGEKQFADAEGIVLNIRENNVTVAADGVVSELRLGKSNAQGYREVQDTQFLFPDDYQGITPLIAVEESVSEGSEFAKMRFLTQEESLGLLPESMRQDNLDVMLGRVMLGYLQPDVTATFPDKMGYPEGYVRNNQFVILQKMMRTQMPVWATMFQNELLQTKAVGKWKRAVKAL